MYIFVLHKINLRQIERKDNVAITIKSYSFLRCSGIGTVASKQCCASAYKDWLAVTATIGVVLLTFRRLWRGSPRKQKHPDCCGEARCRPASVNRRNKGCHGQPHLGRGTLELGPECVLKRD